MTFWHAFLADPPPEKVTPGVLGFTVMFALALATYLLIRSMVGHLRKVRYGPGGPDGPPLEQETPPDVQPAAARQDVDPPQAGDVAGDQRGAGD